MLLRNYQIIVLIILIFITITNMLATIMVNQYMQDIQT